LSWMPNWAPRRRAVRCHPSGLSNFKTRSPPQKRPLFSEYVTGKAAVPDIGDRNSLLVFLKAAFRKHRKVLKAAID